MARKHKHPEHVNHERWLVSYADFITLLFATFTMLFAISNVEKSKMALAAQSINKAFGGAQSAIAVPTLITPTSTAPGGSDTRNGIQIAIKTSPAKSSKSDSEDDANDSEAGKSDGKGTGEGLASATSDSGSNSKSKDPGGSAGGSPDATPTPTPTPTPSTGATSIGSAEGHGDSAMAAKLKQMLSTLGLNDKVNMREEQRGTVISLGETAFFDPGEVEVKPSSTYQLDKVVNALRDQNFVVRVEGFTDNTPIKSGRYKSNLDLSTLRASHIADFMVKQYNYPPEMVSAAGYGEQKPIASNDTPEGQKKNRRIDIVILNQQAKAQEPGGAK